MRIVANAGGGGALRFPRSAQRPKASPATPRSATAAKAGVWISLLDGAASVAPETDDAELAEAESASYSSTISRSSSARSLIDCTRWSGLLARQRRMSRRSSAGALSFHSSTGTGFSLRILCIVSTPVEAANGSRRVAAS